MRGGDLVKLGSGYEEMRKWSDGTYALGSFRKLLVRKGFDIRFLIPLEPKFPTKGKLGDDSIENWQSKNRCH